MNKTPIAWLRQDGLKAMPDIVKTALLKESATHPYYQDIANEYNIPLYQESVSEQKTSSYKSHEYTYGHCVNKKAPGGCQLHNVQCAYPHCDRKVK